MPTHSSMWMWGLSATHFLANSFMGFFRGLSTQASKNASCLAPMKWSGQMHSRRASTPLRMILCSLRNKSETFSITMRRDSSASSSNDSEREDFDTPLKIPDQKRNTDSRLSREAPPPFFQDDTQL